MKRPVKYILYSLILSTVISCSKTTVGDLKKKNAIDPAGFTLIWSDEFATEGSFDTSRWSYAPRGRVAWNKYMTHSSKYVYQKDDKLWFRMDNAKIDGDDVPYHSGGVQSLGKFNIRYGKVEVRAKFSRGRGSWPAIWMMPEPAHSLGVWPSGGEIDIMEHVNMENVIHQTIHNAAVTDAGGGSKATNQATFNPDGYNTYSIIWTPQAIEFYVNETLGYTYRKPIDATIQQWPFDVPFYIILNQAGGAGWPGPITDADLPFSMAVDYVRVYNLPVKQLDSIAPFKPVPKKKELTDKMKSYKAGLIVNGTFEGNTLSPWTVWGNTAISDTEVHTGNYAIRSLGGETAMEQVVKNLKPNTTYRFGGYVRVGAKGESVVLGVKDHGADAVNTTIENTHYSESSVIFTTGPTSTSAKVYFYKPNNGSAFADNFYLLKL